MKSEINIYLVLIILFIHWVADFIMQNDDMAQGKSKSAFWLLTHTMTYTLCWSVPILIMFYIFNTGNTWVITSKATLFLFITFVAHTITDYFTSRLNSKLWNEKKVHWFFVSVGFDQFLHFAQLLLTFQILCL